MTGIRGTYANGFAPRDGMPLYQGLWHGCVGAWNPGLGPTGLSLRDWSGRGNHGTLTNMDAGTDWVSDSGRTVLDFDGSNDYVTTACGKAVVGSRLSYSMWIKLQSFSTQNAVFSVADTFNSGSPFVLFQADSATNMKWYANSNYQVGIGSISIVIGEWYHMGITYDGAAWRAYKNGKFHGSYTGVIGTNTGTTMYIGSGYYFPWPGRINDVLAYNRMLTDGEMALLGTRQGIAYEMAPRRRTYLATAATTNRRRRILLGNR